MKFLGRLGLFVGGLTLEWIFSRYLSLNGLNPQVLLILVVNVAAYGGPSEAMIFGFAWGLCWDAMSLRLFGARALALTLVGYIAGNLRRQVDILSPGSQALVVIFATFFYRLCLGFISLLFAGRFLWLGWGLFLLEPFYNALASIVLYLLRPRAWIRPGAL